MHMIHLAAHGQQRQQKLQHLHRSQQHVEHAALHGCRLTMHSRELVSFSGSVNSCRIACRTHELSLLIFWNTSLSASALPRAYHVALAGFPSQPALPNSCQKQSRDDVGPQCTTLRMSGISIPIPNAMVQTSTLMTEFAFANSVSVKCCSSSDMCA